MPNIFGREIGIGKPFASDAATLHMDAGGGGGASNEVALVQNLAVQYQQIVNQLWEVGGNNTYLVGGKARGTMQMAKVIAPGSGGEIGDDFYDICNIEDNHMNLKLGGGCDQNTEFLTLKLHGVLVTNFGVNVTANDTIVTQQLQMMFLDLEQDQG